MRQYTPIISIGFDKNGEEDFEISGAVSDLTLSRMNDLRRMIPVAVGIFEDMFRQSWRAKAPLVAKADERTIK